MIFLTSPPSLTGAGRYGGDWVIWTAGFLGGVAVGSDCHQLSFHAAALRMSTTGLTARAFGAEIRRRWRALGIQPLLLALGAGVTLCISHAAYRAGFTYCRRERRCHDCRRDAS